jgi:preprotein translocase subunit SecA
MTRPERHREIKTITKEFEYIQKHTRFPRLLKDESLQKLTKESIDLLTEKKHEDKVLQEKYDTFIQIFQRVYSLENRLQYLKVGYKTEPTPSSDSKIERPVIQAT